VTEVLQISKGYNAGDRMEKDVEVYDKERERERERESE
jgi:hypothetical protein